MDTRFRLDELEQWLGQELGVSDWVTVNQERINQFADCTGDHQWIHVDTERAQRESPFGATIAHGFLTLALTAPLQMQIGIAPEGAYTIINYGLDRVRFLTPVKAGSRVRNRVVLIAAEPKSGGQLLKTQNTIEIEGENKPALIAECLLVVVPQRGF